MLATAPAKSGAAQFLSTLKSEGRASLRDDLIAALKAAASLTSARKAVIYVGDGLVWGNPEESRKVVNEITSRNAGRAIIHTVGVSPYAHAEEFLKTLAARNGGTYKRVE